MTEERTAELTLTENQARELCRELEDALSDPAALRSVGVAPQTVRELLEDLRDQMARQGVDP